MNSNLKNRFVEFIKKNKLFLKNERILVAVSGGVDSVVLLHLLNQCKNLFKIDIAIIHLNHMLRGKEANLDEKFVEQLASTLNIKFYNNRIDVSKVAKDKKISVEEAGHLIRKEEFTRVAREEKFDKIVTAHHMDDQAETILMRLISGSGIQGLAGIRLQKDGWVRPLLFASRLDIINYAKEMGLKYRIDHSNVDKSIFRNRIRHQLLPLIKENYNQQAPKHLAQFSEIFMEWDEYLQKEVKGAMKNHVKQLSQFKIQVDIIAIRLYFSGILIKLIENLLKILYGQSFYISFNQYSDFKLWTDNGSIGSTFYWGNEIYSVKRKDKIVFFVKQYKNKQKFEISLGKEYCFQDYNIRLKLEFITLDKIQFTDDRNVELIDGSRLKFPLKLRVWKNGDRFVPLGLSSSQLVSDYLTDHQVHRPEKDQVLVLLNKNEIVAVIGIQISNKYKVQKNSNVLYKLTVENIN
jgi:tRNA(Ile)-lysidine synthase